jgi:hypothetical protein
VGCVEGTKTGLADCFFASSSLIGGEEGTETELVFGDSAYLI